ncbi:YncE family protein [Rothia aeria]|uniref:YncE family protein n=1 Tax=Rothia aeria TaxID=172042 RepID=UPI00288A8A1C|nr:hypothetical protein [Rothia aeria]
MPLPTASSEASAPAEYSSGFETPDEHFAAAACSYRSVRVHAQQTQGLPGQYLAAYSAKTHKLYVSSIFNFTPAHGSTVATIARVNPQTLQIEATAKMPVTEEIRAELAGQYQFRGAFGIDIDDEHGTIWVSDASSYAVTVYRQDALEQGTLQPVWTSYDPAKGLFEQDIKHPREVYVDAANGKAFVTGMGGFWVIDTATFEVQKVDPAPGVLSHPMTIARDTHSGNLYMGDYYLDQVYEVDPTTHTVVRTLPVPAGDVTHFGRVKVHGVVTDHALDEIYVSTQGYEGKNTGVHVLDKTTGALKHFIRYGVTPTDMVIDEKRHLIYLGDFGAAHTAEPSGGTVAVIDACAGIVVGQVRVASAKINHLTLLPDGSVVVLDKAGDHRGVTVDFHIDALTGEFTPSSVDTHSGKQTRIDADSLTKISVQDTGTKPGTVRFRSVIPLATGTSGDGSTVGIPAVVVPGQTVEISGLGWAAGEKRHPDLPPTFPALKIPAQLRVKADGDIVHEFQAKQLALDTYFITDFRVPTAWKPGQEHTITVESATEPVRSASVTVRVAEYPQEQLDRECVACEQPDTHPTVTPFAGYPVAGGHRENPRVQVCDN